MEYLIIMDVSGDINEEIATPAGVKYVPMEYSLGAEMRTCKGMEDAQTIKMFYDGQRNGDLTKTSQISPYMYEEFMEPFMKEGYSILYFCLSSGLSSTYQSACLARSSLKEKYPEQDFLPVDTLAATGGMGVLTERAIRNREKGMSLQENYDDVCEASKHICHWFVVQDLMYLKRGGRVSAASAAVGTFLNVKPILCINKEGKLDTIAKKRGNKQAVKDLLDRFKESADLSAGDVIYVINADAQDLAADLDKGIKALYPEAVIRHASLSPIIGAHTGPGMAAICHMGK